MNGAIPSRGNVVLSIILLFLLTATLGSIEAVEINSVDDCRELVRRHPDNIEAYRSYWVLARQRDQWEQSIDGLETLLVEDPGQPRALLYLGMIATDRGEQRAEDLLTRAAEAFAAEGEPTGEVYSRLGLAHWLDLRMRVDDSRRQRELALEAANGSDDPLLAGRVQLARGWKAVRDHDFATARKLFLEVEEIAFPDGPFDVQVSAVDGLGYTDWATGRYRSAMAQYRRQAALNAAGGDIHQEKGALYNAALMAGHLAKTPADLARVEAAASEALEATLRSGDRELEARIRLILAEPHDGSPKRRGEASKALAAARAAVIPELEIQAIRALAVHDLEAGRDPADAIGHIRGAVRQAQSTGSLHQEIVGRLVLAGALWSQNADQDWMPESLAALDLVDRLRTLQTADEERARIASTWSHAFYQPIGRLLETGDPNDRELALEFMERLRTHSLIDLLEAAGAQAPGPLDNPTSSVAAVQAALADDEVLVSYQLADRFDIRGRPQGGAWLIVITPRDFTAHPLPDLRDIGAAVDVYLGLVRQGNPREAGAAHRLYTMLIAPVFRDSTEPIASLVVVPDGILSGLPFAALLPEPGGPPLVDDVSVALAPSVASWLQQRTVTDIGTGEGCLGIADPELADESTDQPPLPYARAEVRRACRLVGGGSRVVTGADATEAAVRHMLRDPFDVVHFATHAEVDSAYPARTAILLGSEDSKYDGRLSIAEVSNLQLDEPIVVLSACRSAVGVVLQGEGVLGLTRAFIEGGARTVVGNLWSVEDRDASVLVDHFYRHLVAGSSVADALAGAQRELWAAGEPTRAWAGLVVLGDGDHSLAPGRRAPRPWLKTILAAAVAALGLIIAAKLVRSKTQPSRLNDGVNPR